MTRRETLAQSARFAACMALATASPSWAEQRLDNGVAPLKSAGTCVGASIGIAADKAALQDPAIARMVIRNFNLLTASGLKWDRLRPAIDRYDFSEADWNVHFAEQNEMQVHGHNLCWNSPQAYPAWFKAGLTHSNAEQILTEHISTVMKRYEGRIDSWDVVNEPVVPWSGRSDGLYPGIWLDLLGPDYIDIAFHAAALADSKALRVLNIHHVEQGTPDNELNRLRALELLRQLIARGVPVQAVGFESHLDAAQPLGGDSFHQFVTGIRSLGLHVFVTELDVKETRTVGGSQTWDESAAEYYENYLAEIISAANPRCVIFWSFKDRWENGRRIQGLLENNLHPRLTYSSALKGLQEERSCRDNARN